MCDFLYGDRDNYRRKIDIERQRLDLIFCELDDEYVHDIPEDRKPDKNNKDVQRYLNLEKKILEHYGSWKNYAERLRQVGYAGSQDKLWNAHYLKWELYYNVMTLVYGSWDGYIDNYDKEQQRLDELVRNGVDRDPEIERYEKVKYYEHEQEEWKRKHYSNANEYYYLAACALIYGIDVDINKLTSDDLSAYRSIERQRLDMLFSELDDEYAQCIPEDMKPDKGNKDVQRYLNLEKKILEHYGSWPNYFKYLRQAVGYTNMDVFSGKEDDLIAGEVDEWIETVDLMDNVLYIDVVKFIYGSWKNYIDNYEKEQQRLDELVRSGVEIDPKRIEAEDSLGF
ncbi:hypothetical protein [Ligilactobacillus equi]|uniref:hypothetical protein n=1 Tax=Ligilactobacillus equi TaxID=137357 RepID=UPI000469FE3D|nr:hypothetical protein [Ligilactobacillus equi]